MSTPILPDKPYEVRWWPERALVPEVITLALKDGTIPAYAENHDGVFLIRCGDDDQPQPMDEPRDMDQAKEWLHCAGEIITASTRDRRGA